MDIQEELRAILTAGPQPLMKPSVAVDQAIASLTSLIDRERAKELQEFQLRVDEDGYMFTETYQMHEYLHNRISTLTPGGSDNE